MATKAIKLLLGGLILLLGVVIMHNTSYASSIVTQGVDNAVMSSPSGDRVIIPASYFSGQVVRSITFKFQTNGTTGTNYIASGIGRCDAGTTTTCTHLNANFFPDIDLVNGVLADGTRQTVTQTWSVLTAPTLSYTGYPYIFYIPFKNAGSGTITSITSYGSATLGISPSPYNQLSSPEVMFFSIDNTITPPPYIGIYDTRITPNTPIENLNTPSTTVNISTDYYYNSTQSSYAGATQLVLNITRLDDTMTPISHTYSITNDAPTTQTDTETLTAGGTYQLVWAFTDVIGNTKLLVHYNFGVVSGTGTGTGLLGAPTPTSPSSCAILTFDAMPCLVEVMRYLFVPSSNTFDTFTQFRDTIKHKPPIGYIVDTYSALTSINDTSTPTLTIASMGSLNTNIFTPLRDGLAWVLWIMFSFFLVKRFMHFEI